MSGHDIRRDQRIMAWVSRIILAVRDDDLDAAWSVLNETHDHPETLRMIAIAAASMAATGMTDSRAEALAAAMVDKLAAPPRGRWYPGDPEDDPNNPPPPHHPGDTDGLG